MSKTTSILCVSKFLYDFLFYYSVLWKLKEFHFGVNKVWGVDENRTLETEDTKFLGIIEIME